MRRHEFAACAVFFSLVLTTAAAAAEPVPLDSVNALLERGIHEREGGRLEAAIAIFREAAGRAPEASSPRFELAITLSWHGELDEALAEYAMARKAAPNNRAIRIAEARTLGWAGRLDSALQAFEALEKETPNDPEVLRGLAEVRRLDFDYSGARAAYERVLVSHPGDRDAVEGLAATKQAPRVGVRASLGGSTTNGGPWVPQGDARIEAFLRPRVTPFVGYSVDTSPVSNGTTPVVVTDTSKWLHVVDGGVKLAPSKRVDLVIGERSYFVPATSWHGPFAEAYVKVGKHVVPIVGSQPMASTAGHVGHLSHAGLQGVVAGDNWLLAQVFRYDDSSGEHSTAVVGTGQIAFGRPVSVKLGGGHTWHSRGEQTLFLAEACIHVTERAALVLHGEGLTGFMNRGLVRSGVQVAF